MCTHAPQFHQHHDVKMASLLCRDSPRYTDVKQRQFEVNKFVFMQQHRNDVVGYDWAYTQCIFDFEIRKKQMFTEARAFSRVTYFLFSGEPAGFFLKLT